MKYIRIPFQYFKCVFSKTRCSTWRITSGKWIWKDKIALLNTLKKLKKLRITFFETFLMFSFLKTNQIYAHTKAFLSWWTRCWKVSMGRWFHHVWLTTHRKRWEKFKSLNFGNDFVLLFAFSIELDQNTRAINIVFKSVEVWYFSRSKF